MSNRLRCRLVSSLLAAAVLVWYAGRRYSDPPWNCDASSPVGARHGDRMGDQFFRHLACRVLDRSAVRPRSIQSFHRYFVDWNKSDSDPLASDSACRIGDGHSSGRGPTFPFAECTGYPDDTSLERWHEIYRQRKTLLDEFQWRAEIVAAVEHVLTPIKAERAYSNMIGVHARRGYFEKHSNSPHKDSNSAWAAYFNDAIDYFRRNYATPIFVVLSDDASWARENIEGEDVFHLDNGNETDPGWNLAILARCDHFIMTYGTFDLMAAFMVPGETVHGDSFNAEPDYQTEILKLLKLPEFTFLSV